MPPKKGENPTDENSATVATRLPKDTKKAFYRMCEKLGEEPAEVLRNMIWSATMWHTRGMHLGLNKICRYYGFDEKKITRYLITKAAPEQTTHEAEKPLSEEERQVSHTPPIQSRNEGEEEVRVYTCPVCGFFGLQEEEEGLFCLRCQRVVIPKWKLFLWKKLGEERTEKFLKAKKCPRCGSVELEERVEGLWCKRCDAIAYRDYELTLEAFGKY